MFSGIVEELGRVKNISRRGNLTLLEIATDKVCRDAKIGESIAVNGVCLSIVRKESASLFFEAMPETLKITNLGRLRVSERVNLERSLKIGDRLSGHFVTGHIDCPGLIRRKNYLKGNLSFEIAVPHQFTEQILKRGSIAVDGISLTVADKRGGGFTVYLIPQTVENTTLGFKGPADKVNIEFDMLAKKQAR